MISEARLRAELACTLNETRLPGLGEPLVGKVRDSYKLPGRRILVTTDRLSAFDCVLGTVPFKGQVLNQLAAFWFDQTRSLAPNHVLDVPDPNVMVAAECEQLPLEFILRAYVTGVTETSLWTHYARGVRTYCGHRLPDGLRKDEKLPRPILTPTTKLEAHDRPISRDEALAENLIDARLFDKAAEMCWRLFEFGTAAAARRGLILVDTKYELGLLDGKLVVSDEIHTPDSSRYWFADTYEERFARGEEQRKLDKEYVREWFAAHGFRGHGSPPPMPDAVRLEAARRYIQAYETLTGLDFAATDEPIAERLEANLRRRGYLK